MLLVKRNTIAKIFYRVIMESIFDDYDDKTEAVIPWDMDPESKEEIISRYKSSGTPYVMQSDPRDNPDKADPFKMTPRQRKIYIWHIAQKLADDYPRVQAKILQGQAELERKRDERNAARIQQIIQRARDGHIEATGVLDSIDYYDEDASTLDLERTATEDYEEDEKTMLPVGRSKTF